MKKIFLLLFFIVVSYNVTAQFTLIPDEGFEWNLINLNIDSDGTINGQILTDDIENVTELIIDNSIGWTIYSLVGIQDFASLEKLTINYSEITELDVSQNLQLKELDCSNNWLTSIDVSSNVLLEVLRIGNYGGDVGPFNGITELDLSNNPLIHTIGTVDLGININLKNGNNNSNMTLDISLAPFWDTPEPPYPNVCIIVDDKVLAENNQFPYSEWTIYHDYMMYSYADNVEECFLNTASFAQNEIKLYPNPANQSITIANLPDNASLTITDITGKTVYNIQTANEALTIDSTDFTSGIYIVRITHNGSSIVRKMVVSR